MLPEPHENDLELPRTAGGQPDNVNAAKHGRKSPRYGFVLVELAKGLVSVKHGLVGLRKNWIARAKLAHGEDLDWPVLSAISRALDYERARQCGQRLAASKWADDPERALEIEKQAARAAEDRDGCLKLAFAPVEKPDLWSQAGVLRASDRRKSPSEPVSCVSAENSIEGSPNPSGAARRNGSPLECHATTEGIEP